MLACDEAQLSLPWALGPSKDSRTPWWSKDHFFLSRAPSGVPEQPMLMIGNSAQENWQLLNLESRNSSGGCLDFNVFTAAKNSRGSNSEPSII